jgi:hypothetical protein
MQTIIRNTRKSLEAQLASGKPVGAGIAVTSGLVGTGFAGGANPGLTASGPSGMQSSGGRTSGPGDDV